MRDHELVASWRSEEATPFSGWDFSRIASRFTEEKPPWSYAEIARELLKRAKSALDLGTGGGEVLSSMRDAFPDLVVATEGYAQNVPIARSRLAPLGVHVVACGIDDQAPIGGVQDRPTVLPFRDASIDVVLSRHEAYDARDVLRVLRPGGSFLTQQQDGRSYSDLLRPFGASPQWPGVTAENLGRELVDAGFSVELMRSWWGHATFRDVGALVYYLRAIPWMVPGFSVDRSLDVLMDLQADLEREGQLRFGVGWLLISARKPARSEAPG